MENEYHETSVDLDGENIHWAPEGGLSYSRYLDLDKILNAQEGQTDEHDETLFIIIHQASELWMKLCLHELDAAVVNLQQNRLRPAMKMLTRVARIQEQLTQSWSVLATMTPNDYLKFRVQLKQGSGFQSWQYRSMEYRLGNKNPKLMSVFQQEPVAHASVKAALEAPSLYDETLITASRYWKLDLPESTTKRDWSKPYEASSAVEAMWQTVYRDPEQYWELYEFAEKLVDLEHKFHQWRFNHMKTVERIIGYRRGTGGSSGVGYLIKALDLRFFPELWTVRTEL